MNPTASGWSGHGFNYNGWIWALLKPADLFTPGHGLTATQERVATRLWAHANMKTGFTWVAPIRIAALLARLDQNGSVTMVSAARAELRRRGFIERASEGGRSGWRLLPPEHWLHESEAGNDQERGVKSRAARLSRDGGKSRSATSKVAQRDFRPLADNIEGTIQGTLPFNSNGAGANQPDPPPSLLDPFVVELMKLGVTSEDAASVAEEFGRQREKLAIALANLSFDLRRGKTITSPRGYIADQILQNRAPKQGAVIVPVVLQNGRAGELPAPAME